MKKILVIVAAALSILAFGCKSTGGVSSADKGPTPSAFCGEWKIQSLTGFNNAEQTGAELSILANEEGQYSLSGYSGVNSYFSTLADSPKAFPIGNNMGSTKMMGAPEDMSFEDKLLEVLTGAKSWKIEGGKLVITDGKTVAVFSK